MHSLTGLRFAVNALVLTCIALSGFAAGQRPTRTGAPATSGSTAPLAPIPQARIIPGVVAWQDKLWVIGGHIARTRTTAAVKYLERKDLPSVRMLTGKVQPYQV